MNDNERLIKLNKIADEEINPELSKHLGGVRVTTVTENVAYVKFSGSCRNCYYATDTLDNTVKAKLLERDKELIDVKLDETVEEDILDFARNLLKKDK